MAGNGLEMAGMGVNCWSWLERAEIAEYGQKWLEMAGNDLN